MIQPKAFIFDLDGVVANTIDLHHDAWKRLAEEEGSTFDRADMDRMRGWQRRDIMADILSPHKLTETDFQRLSIRKTELFYAALYQQSQNAILLPGAMEIIRYARSRGFKVGLASSSASAKIVLEHAGILNLFDAVADGHTVKRSKPAPDVFLWTAGALKVTPADAVVFEDSEAGVQAALRAGMFAIGVGEFKLVHAAHLCFPGLDSAEYEQILTTYAMFRTGNKPAMV